MSYSQFTIEGIKSEFGINLSEKVGFFAHISERKYSELLRETLEYNIPLALSINSEKSRSEMIVTPILIEIRKQFMNQISLFSGIDFTVDSQQGLGGICDFLISRSPEQLFVRAPVIVLVEAKNENLKSGFAQCIAEMLAAQLFNTQENNPIDVIYGAVTIGTLWRFLRLSGTVVELDLTEYFIKDISKILGILFNMVEVSGYDGQTATA
jgi:hypothetical protein